MTEQTSPAEGQTPVPEAAEGQTEVATSKDDAVRKAYSHASSTLREKYRDEFNKIVKEKAKDLGYEWSPKKTKEEKAREEFEALLRDYPDLAKSFEK